MIRSELLGLALLLSGLLAAAAPSTQIKVDQAGYPLNARKLAMVTASSPVSDFVIRDASSKAVVFRGTATAPVEDADSGDRVQTLDFSAFTKAGTYVIEVADVGESWPFAIAPKVYSRAYYLAMRSFYGQRCGIAVDLGPEFPGYKHDVCHTAGAFHASSGKSGAVKNAGGWHDAGDYGRYVVNSGISTATLLWAFELFGTRVKDFNLHLPESGNGVPDMLNEIRWNLNWMLSMQDTDGGVWHKQTSERFCAFILPEKDTLPSYIVGTGAEPFKSSCATADLAAVAAIAARVYRPFDRAFSERCLQAAKLAWSWLDKNSNVLFRNPPGVSTGEYGDRNCGDERFWAAAELWRTTGDSVYNDYFLHHAADARETIRANGPPGWPNVAPLGLWTYALGARGDKATIEAIRNDSLKAADAIAERTRTNGYRMSLTTKDYNWGSNSVVANYAMQLLIANQFRRNPEFVAAALDNLHYLLGRNALSLSFVTQVGANPFRHPHHRPSGADSNPEPWPGLLSGGPNGRRQDPAMQKLLVGDIPPAKMYLDEQDSYASNEVAINWNAPLVFVLAGLLD